MTSANDANGFVSLVLVSHSAAIAEGLAELEDVDITVEGWEDEKIWADFPPARSAAQMRAAMPVTETLLRRNVRQVSVGNDLLAPPGAVDALCGLLRSADVSRWHHGERLSHAAWVNQPEPIAAGISRWIDSTVTGKPWHGPGGEGDAVS